MKVSLALHDNMQIRRYTYVS